MKIKVCDRCGKQLGACVDFLDSRSRFFIKQFIPFLGPKDIDLCYNCEQDFEKWLMMKPEKKEAADDDP